MEEEMAATALPLDVVQVRLPGARLKGYGSLAGDC